jgi:hypothetical protein
MEKANDVTVSRRLADYIRAVDRSWNAKCLRFRITDQCIGAFAFYPQHDLSSMNACVAIRAENHEVLADVGTAFWKWFDVMCVHKTTRQGRHGKLITADLAGVPDSFLGFTCKVLIAHVRTRFDDARVLLFGEVLGVLFVLDVGKRAPWHQGWIGTTVCEIGQ